MDEYGAFDATGLASLVRRREIHPRELVAAAIARIEERNPSLNAVIHQQFERARRDAENVPLDARFAGVPFVLKDFKGREAGEPYHMGVRTLRDVDYRPRSDSTIARRFRSAGLIPLGRTNVPEMALMGTTEPRLYGPTHNPWDLARSPGGSSGGSAAAVAAGLVPVAHANDISGSIRIPAAMCGLVGLKPTRGRVVTSTPADPAVGMFVEGVITRSVRDTAALVDLLSERSSWWPAPRLARPLIAEVGRDPGRLRVGVWTTSFSGAHVEAGCATAALDAARLLEAMGHLVEESAPNALSRPELWAASRLAMAATAAGEAAAWTERLGHPLGVDDVEPRSWDMINEGLALSAPRLLATIEELQAWAADASVWWDSHELLVTPTTAIPAFPLGQAYQSGAASGFTRPLNVTGQPAISLPLGWPDDGLPRGVQIVAPYGREDVLIKVASAIEAAAPWAHRRPPTVA